MSLKGALNKVVLSMAREPRHDGYRADIYIRLVGLVAHLRPGW